MPGTDERSRARIEAGWWRRGFEDARAGRPEAGPDTYVAGEASAIGLDIRGAYQRGYRDGSSA